MTTTHQNTSAKQSELVRHALNSPKPQITRSWGSLLRSKKISRGFAAAVLAAAMITLSHNNPAITAAWVGKAGVYASQARNLATPYASKARNLAGVYIPKARNAAGMYASRARNVAGVYIPKARNAAGMYASRARNVAGVYGPKARDAARKYSKDVTNAAKKFVSTYMAVDPVKASKMLEDTAKAVLPRDAALAKMLKLSVADAKKFTLRLAGDKQWNPVTTAEVRALSSAQRQRVLQFWSVKMLELKKVMEGALSYDDRTHVIHAYATAVRRVRRLAASR